MEDLTPLSENDPDASLARRLVEGDSGLGDDRLANALVDYRSDVRRTAPSIEFSDSLWQRVTPGSTTRLRLVRQILSAAAIVLIAFGIWTLYPSSPSLVATASSKILRVELDDGSSVALRPNSSLFRLAKNDYLLEGEAYFQVAHDASRTFGVKTINGMVRVIGTKFVVSSWTDETSVFLEEGLVSFEHLPSARIDTLLAGDELGATNQDYSIGQSSSSGAGPMDWLSESLVFAGRPLKKILAELEHHYGITLVVPVSLETETLSGRITLADSQTSLQDIATVLGGRFATSDSTVFVFSFD